MAVTLARQACGDPLPSHIAHNVAHAGAWFRLRNLPHARHTRCAQAVQGHGRSRLPEVLGGRHSSSSQSSWQQKPRCFRFVAAQIGIQFVNSIRPRVEHPRSTLDKPHTSPVHTWTLQRKAPTFSDRERRVVCHTGKCCHGRTRNSNHHSSRTFFTGLPRALDETRPCMYRVATAGGACEPPVRRRQYACTGRNLISKA